MKSYLNVGNIFSKAFFIKDAFFNEQKKISLLTKEENILKYQKIFSQWNLHLSSLDCVSKLIDLKHNTFGTYVIPHDIFLLPHLNVYQLENTYHFSINVNDVLPIDDLVKKLIDFWYVFHDFLEWGDYKKAGDSLHICFKDSKWKYLISYWDDTIESIHYQTGSETQNISKLSIGKIMPLYFFETQEKTNPEMVQYFQDITCVIDQMDIHTSYDDLSSLKNATYFDILKNTNKDQINLKIDDVYIDSVENLIKTLQTTKKVFFYTKNKKALQNFLSYNNLPDFSISETSLTILKSFQDEEQLCICDDILGKLFVKKRLKKSLSENIDLMLQIKPWDYIVHIDHGIGIFKQILEKTLGSITKEYIEIEYKNNDTLYVPITEIKRLSKYIGKENPSLTWLSTKEWTKKLEKVQEDVQLIAEELLEIFAQRKIKKGFAFERFEKELTTFQKSFDYEYTLDQANAIEEIFQDMSKPTPMERILVGDVGFGKTEVAFNAIYNAFLNKKQSILISPLVVLAYEHYNKALSRFSDFPIRIEVLTRFETAAEAKRIFDKLKHGEIDLVIGTHRLLSENIIYKNLWLLVIDEEHKFWVQEKEKIKELKNNIDILSMSATPIPRSLNMALNGIRDISILSKAPAIRKWVETYVSHFEDSVIMQAAKKEFERGWQVFFIHNRVETIEAMGKYLQELFPHKSIIITHGQLPWHELEERILAFKRKDFDILLSSTVIENGIDFPNVNTIFINDAYKFWISQIHQLRGRVGRSDKMGYCYLLFKKDKIKEDAVKRLQTVVEYSHLGAGFELAIKDLEIRGWGDILWIRQSWSASEVGINVFLKMLEEKVEELKAKTHILWEEDTPRKKIDTVVDLNVAAYLKDEYFSSELDKIHFYREIESIYDMEELHDMIEDFKELNADLTPENTNLFLLLEVRILAHSFDIVSIKRAWVSYEINFRDDITIEGLKKFLDRDEKVVFIVSDLKKLKTSTLKFAWDDDFLHYMYAILSHQKKAEKKKIKLKK